MYILTNLISSLMSLVIPILIIVFVWKKYKKKQEAEKKKVKIKSSTELQEIFKTRLQNHFDSFKSRDDYFINQYELIMEKYGVDKNQIDKITLSLPRLKDRFSASCQNLINFSQNNACLWDEKKLEQGESFLTDSKISSDIIEILPVLSEYFEIREILYENIYRDIFGKKIILQVNEFTFAILNENAEKHYKSDEEFQKAKNAFYGYFSFCYDLEIERIIKEVLNLDRNYDIKNSSDPSVKMLLSLSDDYDDLLDSFLHTWFDKMHKIGMEYANIYFDLHEYFDNIAKEVRKYIPWFYCSGFIPAFDGLSLKDQTKEECLRVLDLYKKGKIHGCYYKYKDPKYNNT